MTYGIVFILLIVGIIVGTIGYGVWSTQHEKKLTPEQLKEFHRKENTVIGGILLTGAALEVANLAMGASRRRSSFARDWDLTNQQYNAQKQADQVAAYNAQVANHNAQVARNTANPKIIFPTSQDPNLPWNMPGM
jgi:hypothetical protein